MTTEEREAANPRAEPQEGRNVDAVAEARSQGDKAAARRGPDENYEPYEEPRGVPMPVLWISVALTIWGVVLLYDSSRDSVLTQTERVDTVVDQQITAEDSGATLFASRCATCHQPNGVGLRDAVPPLAGSEFVVAGPEVVVPILLRGIDGPIRVAGADFSGHMPNFSSALTDAEVAQVATYVTQRWGGAEAAVDPDMVAQMRPELASAEPFRGGEEIAATVPAELPEQPDWDAATAAAVPPEVARLISEGRGVAWPCASCHGDLGQGGESTPRLSGLPAGYIAKQLHDFRKGRRLNESMQLVAASLTEEEMTALGEYYAGLRAPSNAFPSIGGDVERGEELALRGDWNLGVPACFSCHGPSGFGVAPGFPGLAAQHPAYTASQLAAWAGGERMNSELNLMTRISLALDDGDRRAVADYLASLPPAPAREGGREAAEGAPGATATPISEKERTNVQQP